MSAPPLVPPRSVHDGPTCPLCGEEPDSYGPFAGPPGGPDVPAEFGCLACRIWWPMELGAPGVFEICDEPGEHYPECHVAEG